MRMYGCGALHLNNLCRGPEGAQKGFVKGKKIDPQDDHAHCRENTTRVYQEGLMSIQSILDLNDPELRNLKITQCYHDLSRDIASLIRQDNANWCTFATWASKTAGRFVRNNTLSKSLLDALNQSRRYAFVFAGLDTLALLDPVHAVIKAISRDITIGNLKVFAELGPIFERMVSAFRGGTNLNNLLNSLQQGTTAAGGQDALRSAITHFHEAMQEPDPTRKAEKILLANAQIGEHEQIRLQPHIKGALDAPIAQTLRSLALANKDIEPLLAPLVDPIAQSWREIVTSFLMQLTLPDGPLQLGAGLQPPPGQSSLFPPALQQINDNDLRTLLVRYGALNAVNSGTADWADLDQRMRFILTFFRSWQQHPRLFTQPFTDVQRREIDAGRMPTGDL